mgnify:CR=1 FL=1
MIRYSKNVEWFKIKYVNCVFIGIFDDDNNLIEGKVKEYNCGFVKYVYHLVDYKYHGPYILYFNFCKLVQRRCNYRYGKMHGK